MNNKQKLKAGSSILWLHLWVTDKVRRQVEKLATYRATYLLLPTTTPTPSTTSTPTTIPTTTLTPFTNPSPTTYLYYLPTYLTYLPSYLPTTTPTPNVFQPACVTITLLVPTTYLYYLPTYLTYLPSQQQLLQDSTYLPTTTPILLFYSNSKTELLIKLKSKIDRFWFFDFF